MSGSRVREFTQVDVFGAEPYGGNPLAVVLDGEGLSDETMLAFANWTNLSETTFVLPPSDPAADYRVRIFTPREELPFAGHPTLGTAHAWLVAGGSAKSDDVVVQECTAGLIRIRKGEGLLSFCAPDRIKTGPLEDDVVDDIARSLRIERSAIIDHQWVDNGPGWRAVQLASAQEVLDLEPDFGTMKHLKFGVVGAYPRGSKHRYEVRAFVGPMASPEDPATGSVNASIAQWLIETGAAPKVYTVGQGTCVGRDACISIDASSDGVWVGGAVSTCISGTVLL